LKIRTPKQKIGSSREEEQQTTANKFEIELNYKINVFGMKQISKDRKKAIGFSEPNSTIVLLSKF
jgi:hypothetical protein